MKNSAARLVILGGALAATLDIVYAMTFYGLRNGLPPERLLQSIASGVLGKSAFVAGLPGALLGLSLHFFIAIAAAFVYFAAAQILPLLVRRPWVGGSAFGVLMFGFMNLAVVPLSRFPSPVSHAPFVLTCGLLAHIFLVGVPIALLCRAAVGNGTARNSQETANRTAVAASPEAG